MPIRAVLLDMDGTIWDSPVDWAQLRSNLGLPEDGRPIVEHLKHASSEERARGLSLLEEHEARGASHGRLMPGTHELLDLLSRKRLRSALVTNNSRTSVEKVLSQHHLHFDVVVSRDEIPMKPAAEAFLEPLNVLGCSPDEAVAIGDTHLDVWAAHAAGVAHMILVASKAWSRLLLPKDAELTEVLHLGEARRVLATLLSDNQNDPCQ
ncbi:MAG: HAD family hydrolase [Candidatus Bipolaricaulota bacterium]